MKTVDWTDEKGYIHRSVVPEDAGIGMAKNGIPIGPPDIDRLDWNMIKVEINNFLAREGIWTWDDYQRNPNGVVAALSVIKRHLIDMYREDWKIAKTVKTKLGG